ncbi:NADH-quinone oxidoreductase subunit L [Xinfangfangia sp. D13-10-4-6]|uniref:NADH-quinone oxidoreductase subunit L n=1 Tax=Pseudogemmobacter hezensis TaxID=2737662 RepID=UPI001553ADB4|nr:NADH-quinone oxidoreductase subunit L [Pseudogemmobacter hezensis]NPD15249.1 NADH-quinone oxidoreductase subunit L [Pseudogemmobacter hezensis]
MVQIVFFAPLIGAILCGFGWKVIGEKPAQILTTAAVFLAAALSWVIFLGFDGVTEHHTLLRWVESGTLSTEWAIRVDRMTAIMLVVVNSVSALVHLYSFGYMAHDENWTDDEPYRARFFAYLSFFTFTMLTLVTADNLLQMFFGWEGVGVASYLLIGFYWKKQSAGAAAMKAFIANRVGDFGFILGIAGLYLLTDSIQFDEVFAKIPELTETTVRFLWTDWNAVNLIAFLLFVGAMGKSAQLFLHTWLPDAMEGPTPVSALIHAATMVTAGVFLVCRMSPVYEYAPYATGFITVLGATTAFFAATVGLVQNDIKRVIAYSTCSQLGYMFVAAGVGAYPVAMFHLFTHAFFKAMLFLGAGSVIHATHHEQDMRWYGGLRKKIPFTFWMMMIGTLAITGVGIPLTYYGFAGFLSKDAVIESAYIGSNYAFWMLVIAAGMTSFYSWRLMFLTFFGANRADQKPHDDHAHGHDHGHASHGHDDHAHEDHGHDDHGHHHEPHESPLVMLIPLAVLSLGALFSGMLWYKVFFGDEEKMRDWFGMEQLTAHHVEEAHAEPAADHVVAGETEHAATTTDMTEADAAAAQAQAEALANVDAGVTDPGEAVEAGDHATAHDAAHDAAPHDAAHGVAPKGALLILPYGAEEQAIVDTRVDAKKVEASGHAPNTIIAAAHMVPSWVKVSPFIAMVIGLILSWLFYIKNPSWPGRLARQQRPLYLFLLNKWYFDEVYTFVFVKGSKALGRLFWKNDVKVIDGTINGVALGIVPFFTRLAARVQSGFVFHYAFAMVLGIVALVTWMTLFGGAK